MKQRRKPTDNPIAKKGKAQRRMQFLQGKTNILVIAPHGVFGDDDFTGVIAEELHRRFGFYAVINEKYQKPENVAKRKDGLKYPPGDLGLTKDAVGIELQEKENYLACIEEYANEIIERNGEALILHLHGIEDGNINEAATKLKPKRIQQPPPVPDILIGYGQWEDPALIRFTARDETVDALIKNLKDERTAAVRAPTEAILVKEGKKEEPRWYCGWDSDRMNQYFYDSGLPIESIQLEIRKQGYRETRAMARKTANHLGRAVENLTKLKTSQPETPEPKGQAMVPKRIWSTLNRKPEMRQIRVGEIDVGNTKFVLRTPELGIDQEKLDWLVSTIKSGGIHQNIIIRETPGKDGYQLLSGFRRLSALRKTFEEAGKPDEFKNQRVWAEVYDHSLTDEEAYQVCLSENLAREEPSTWEMSRFLLQIRQGLLLSGKKKGEAIRQLEAITNMDRIKIGRFLRIGAIQNHEIQKDIHQGIIDFSVAAIFAREDLFEDDRSALHTFFKKEPMPFRDFYRCVRNLLRLRKWTKLSVPKLLALPAAKEILALDPDDLKEKVKLLRKDEKGKVQQILENHLEEIKKGLADSSSKSDLTPFLEKFLKKAAPIEKKVNSLFADKKSNASFSIKPTEDFRPDFITLSVSAPLNDATTALSLAVKEIKEDLPSLQAAFRLLPKKEKAEAKKGNAYGAREWAVRSVNCCEGCGRDCVYCYGKYMAAMRKKGQIPVEKWKDQVIRKDKVDKPYGLMKGRTMFPSSHDITPANYDACLTVLKKLLDAGNDVVVVSKPNLEVIKSLCTELKDFKKQFLFRFTITATDDNILSFWEPNAPPYEERKASLKHAFDAGFRTSVSAEPMLDPTNMEDLVDDLSPYVNDAIWIGKMNHLGWIRPVNDAMSQAIKKIEKGQSDENIFEIYETFKDNPKIKWKESIKKVVGIPPVEKAGMDV